MSFRLTATKALRDLTAQRGRAALLVAANAVGLLAFVALVSGYRLLDREMARSFGGSVPASAFVDVEAASNEELNRLVALTLQQPGIVAAELRRTERATAERPSRAPDAAPDAAPERIGLQLFVVESFADPQVSTFTLEEGRAPGLGEIALEQSALGILRSGTGREVVTTLPGGAPQPLLVSGVVHDPGQAPAWMEGMGYGYVTRETLALLLPPGASSLPDELLLAFERGPSFTRAGISAGVESLRSAWRAEHQGEAATDLGRAFIPPPGDHPHQGQMEALLLTLLIFGGFAFVLAAVLNVTTLQALLHAQIPQIGTLKTLGASGRRIAALYALTLGVLGALGAGVGVPLGLLLGRSYADFTGGFLNLRMSSLALEASWLFGLVTLSLLLPVVLALPAVLRATRRTVRECLAASAPSRDAGIAAQLPTGLSGRPLLAYALRNALRRPGRMALSLATLVAANVVLFTAANVGRAWLELLDEADRRQPHSAILRVAPSPGAAASAAAALAEAPAFDAEVWRSYVARSEQRPG
ncbi:MAG: ABC transporter permease, partial [Acidobacteriota bacterium]